MKLEERNALVRENLKLAYKIASFYSYPWSIQLKPEEPHTVKRVLSSTKFSVWEESGETTNASPFQGESLLSREREMFEELPNSVDNECRVWEYTYIGGSRKHYTDTEP